MSYIFFFFFKQKTAYEMRISDWSSDVCSSDLEQAVQVDENSTLSRMAPGSPVADPLAVLRSPKLAKFLQAAAQQYDLVCLDAPPVLAVRSEEHTSELQSLMRISYAVFCLKKKKTITRINSTQTDPRVSI